MPVQGVECLSVKWRMGLAKSSFTAAVGSWAAGAFIQAGSPSDASFRSPARAVTFSLSFLFTQLFPLHYRWKHKGSLLLVPILFLFMLDASNSFGVLKARKVVV